MEFEKDINTLIERYCAKKGKSLSSLSRESGVSYTTIVRIAQGDTKPGLHNTFKILMVLCPNRAEALEFISRHFNDVGNWLAGYLKTNSLTDDRLNRFLTDRVGFLIVNRASINSGLTRHDVFEQFGHDGLALVKEMLDLGVMQEIDGNLKCESFSVTDAETLLTQIRICIESFQVENLGDGMSLASLKVDGWSERGLKVLNKEMKLFLERVRGLQDYPENRGDRVAFILTAMNRLDERKRE